MIFSKSKKIQKISNFSRKFSRIYDFQLFQEILKNSRESALISIQTSLYKNIIFRYLSESFALKPLASSSTAAPSPPSLIKPIFINSCSHAPQEVKKSENSPYDWSADPKDMRCCTQLGLRYRYTAQSD